MGSPVLAAEFLPATGPTIFTPFVGSNRLDDIPEVPPHCMFVLPLQYIYNASIIMALYTEYTWLVVVGSLAAFAMGAGIGANATPTPSPHPSAPGPCP